MVVLSFYTCFSRVSTRRDAWTKVAHDIVTLSTNLRRSGRDVFVALVPVHLIVDNYATHKTTMIRKWFAKRPHFHIHFTPTYGSWINLVERWFAELTSKRIRRGVFRSVKDLETAIGEFIEVHNEDPAPFVWTRTANQILASIPRYAQRTLTGPSPGFITRTIGTGD